MRVVVLTQYFPPDAPGWIADDVARELCHRGHEVRVLTTFPHYATGGIAEGYTQKFQHFESRGQIRVRRVPIVPSHSRNPVGRIANYLSFVCSARIATSFVRNADVVYVHGAPATVAEPAREWAKTLGIPFVYHVQDIWPESVTESGFLPPPVARVSKKIINRWLGGVYSRASAVNVIAPTARSMLIGRGVPEEKCHLIFNWADESMVPLRPMRGESLWSQGLTVIYAGNLGEFQDLETVVKAAARLRDLKNFRLLIAGSGVAENKLKELVDDLQAGSFIEFLGRLNRDQTSALYAEADFQIVSLRNMDFFAGTIPSKFQAGLAHGLPLITTVRGDVTQLVDEHGLGFSAPPEDVERLAATMRAAYATTVAERREFSNRAVEFYMANMSRKSAMDRIESILVAAVASVPGAIRS